ncbi:MAG: response regulator transcription factor [Chloroflexi bacterium]|nr:response regulator transcription factor [Chloroflexota bacterium]
MGDSLAHIISRDSLFVSGLRASLSDLDSFQITGSSVTAEEAVNSFVETTPDLFLVDIEIPNLLGALTIAAINDGLPTLPVIGLYDFESDAHVYACLEAGAAACIAKSASSKDLAALVQRVCHGAWPIYEMVASMPNVAARLAQVLGHTWVAAQPVRPVLTSLSTREQNVLNLLAEGVEAINIQASLEMTQTGLLSVVRSVVLKLTENRNALHIVRYCTA